MKKSEAIARIAQRLGVTPSSVHFANVNSSKDVWWLDIPLTKLPQAGNPNICLLLYDDRSDRLHYLDVPKAYLRDNQRRLAVRNEKGCINLELSNEDHKMFRDVRPGGDGVSFGQFLRDSI